MYCAEKTVGSLCFIEGDFLVVFLIAKFALQNGGISTSSSQDLMISIQVTIQI